MSIYMMNDDDDDDDNNNNNNIRFTNFIERIGEISGAI